MRYRMGDDRGGFGSEQNFSEVVRFVGQRCFEFVCVWCSYTRWISDELHQVLWRVVGRGADQQRRPRALRVPQRAGALDLRSPSFGGARRGVGSEAGQEPELEVVAVSRSRKALVGSDRLHGRRIEPAQ